MAILKVAIIGASAKGRAGISAIAGLQDKYQLVAICILTVIPQIRGFADKSFIALLS